MSKAKLKPCPFCGDEPQSHEVYGRWEIECMNADDSYHNARVIASTEEAAIAAWNRRAK